LACDHVGQPIELSPTDGIGGVGEVGEVGEPVLWLLQLRVAVQGSAALAVGQQSPTRREREQRSTTDRFRTGAVAGVAVEQERFHAADAEVLGGGLGEQRAHP
jgi:hypothetical protein